VAPLASQDQRQQASGFAPRIALVTVFIMTLSALAVGGIVFSEVHRLLISEQSNALEENARVIGLQLRRSLDSLSTDVRVLAGTPPITGLIRAHHNGGWDQQDGSSDKAWRDRLATIFTITIASHPGYAQARYIGLANGGRELVRVDRIGDQVVRIADDELQRKAHRDYVQQAIRLKPGEVSLSAIDLNQEHGHIAEPHQPMVRAATPIYDGGEVFGVVVVNLDFNSVVAQLRRHLPTPSTRLYLTNELGDYLAHPDPSLAFGFDLGTRHRIQEVVPRLQRMFDGSAAEGQTETWREGEDDLMSFIQVPVDPLHPQRIVGVLLQAPYAEVVRDIAPLQRRLFILSCALILCAALVTILIVHWQIRPLRRLTRVVTRRGDGEADFSVPSWAAREVQVLAQALTDMDQQVRDHTRALEAANRELEAFSYSVSHDLQGPLRAINGFSQALREDNGEQLDEIGRGHLNRIQGATLRMNALVDGLLRLSRLARSDLQISPVDLSALAWDVIYQLREGEPGREVAIYIEPGLQALGDPNALRLLLQNLLGNAWKFTQQQATPQIQFQRIERAGQTLFMVRDNGIGFDMAYVHKLFKPFERLHADTAFQGTGIGLATVWRIVERHGGTIQAEGAPNIGATFYFTLPPPPGMVGPTGP